MTYTWEILKLGTLDQTNSDGDVLSDAIISIKWKKIATNDANKKASFVGKTSLDLTDTSAADYIDLDDVTKENVIEWIEGSMTESEINNINRILAKKVEAETMTTFKPDW
jgi:hypothetical protein